MREAFAGVGDDGEGVDGEVLALAAVGVPVEFGEFGAFDEGAGAEGAGSASMCSSERA